MLITTSDTTITSCRLLQILWTLVLLLCCCESIHLEAVLVPQYRYRGSNASLLCKYELEPNEELFSLKWYKEDTEFYRHTPQDPRSQPPPINSYGQPPQFPQYQQQVPVNSGLVQTWQVPGIKIDEEHSQPQHVILKKVTFRSTGTYRCEVTAVIKQRHGYGIQGFVMKESINKMVVVELPQAEPVISGGDIKHKYKPGDTLNLTCTSAPSNPPATLMWIMNKKPVDPSDVVRQHLINMKKGLFSSTIGLLMTLREEHFRDGELRVKCIGKIEAEFWKKDAENIFNKDKDTEIRVLEVKESQWPDSGNLIECNLLLILLMVLMLPALF